MVTKNVVIENARIIFKNFEGRKEQFNPNGNRNFCVLLDKETARAMSEDGWNVRYLKPRDPEEDPQAYVQVAASFNLYPPKVVLISSKKKTLLDEDTIACLDTAEFSNIDIVIRPYNYEVNGKRGVKAYLKTLYATLQEDEFESKYDVLDSDDLPF